MIRRIIALASMLAAAAPALAQGSTRIAEPSDAAIFVIAVIGVIVGRQSSRRPPADPRA